MISKKHALAILSLIILAASASVTEAKSVYVITDSASTVRAYDIQGDQIVEQATAENLVDLEGAVGLALDPDSETLFVTFEDSNVIEMVNAKTMIYEKNEGKFCKKLGKTINIL